MAHIIGTSGAWKAIVEEVRQGGFHVGNPDDIEPLLADLTEAYGSSVARKKAETSRSVRAVRHRIQNLRSEVGFLKRILNWFKVQGGERTILRLRSEETRYVNDLAETIRRFADLLSSRELAGARAELGVAAQLERLTDDHVVIHDIRLKSEQYIHFGGRPLRSAQIDHIVVAPSGVFVIETKWWSRNFVEAREYHDPYDQIQRAGYLCYRLVKEHFGDLPVRKVIACAGALPEPPPDVYVKVLRPTEINGYITWFKTQEIGPRESAQLVKLFQDYC